MSAHGHETISEFLTILDHDHSGLPRLRGALDSLVSAVSRGDRPSARDVDGVAAYFKTYPRQIRHSREALLLDLRRMDAPELSNMAIHTHHGLPHRLTALEAALHAYEADEAAGLPDFVNAARDVVAFERAQIARDGKRLLSAATRQSSAAEWKRTASIPPSTGPECLTDSTI